MGTIKTKGIVLLENNLGDYDKMLTMLTPGLGKISCVAKGARRPKSLLMAGSQFMCFADYLIYKGNDTYNINSCETIEFFYNIRTDLDKYKYAVHITKIILDVANENENSYRMLQLYLNTLYTISETDKNLDLTLGIFKSELGKFKLNKLLTMEKKMFSKKVLTPVVVFTINVKLIHIYTYLTQKYNIYTILDLLSNDKMFF